jgi:hypothetical protein
VLLLVGLDGRSRLALRQRVEVERPVDGGQVVERVRLREQGADGVARVMRYPLGRERLDEGGADAGVLEPAQRGHRRMLRQRSVGVEERSIEGAQSPVPHFQVPVSERGAGPGAGEMTRDLLQAVDAGRLHALREVAPHRGGRRLLLHADGERCWQRSAAREGGRRH